MAMPPEELGYLRVRDGRAPTGAREVAIDAATAEDAGIRVGDRVTVQLAGAPLPATVVGLVAVGASDGLPGAGIVALEPGAAAAAFGRPGTFASIEVAAEDGVSGEELRQRVAAVLPAGVEAVSGTKVGEESAADVGNALRFLPMALLAFAAISLFVGGFLIVNTFGILVRQRMREYGLLRAVGASRAQVVRAVLGEALVTGLLASALGFAVGVGAAHGLQALLGAAGVDMPATELQVRPRTARCRSRSDGTHRRLRDRPGPVGRAGTSHRRHPRPVVAPARVRRRRSIVAGAVTAAAAR
jgi:putative ABC transport system permease protein